jgi:succinyl-CoA synthetase beta subunit
LDLFEYQGKELFQRWDIPVPEGQVATTAENAEKIAESIGGKVVVKAQVRVGGRGKAGGVKLADNPQQARQVAADIIGMDIKGHEVERVLVERASDIKAEYYASIVLDRAAKKFLFMLSSKGGVDIEEVAESDPDAIA